MHAKRFNRLISELEWEAITYRIQFQYLIRLVIRRIQEPVPFSGEIMFRAEQTHARSRILLNDLTGDHIFQSLTALSRGIFQMQYHIRDRVEVESVGRVWHFYSPLAYCHGPF